MNLPNKITVSRMVLTVFFLMCLFSAGVGAKVLALGIFTLAAFTDYIDGRIAKKNNITSDFGRIMDPVADKILTLSAFISFASMGIVPEKIVVIIILREVLVTSFRLKALISGKVLSASLAGKQKTVSQMIAIFVILIFMVLREAGQETIPFWTEKTESYYFQGILTMMILTAILTVISGVSYFLNNRKYLSARN
ncbi:MAG: CDP-diacylglycerol--glycerol-3-phosphate 3-phosphatidyltransferase [Candidatus Omnitrophota bacterium]